jgi:stage II sporulation protein P
MQKRFKTKKRKKHIKRNILFILIIIFISSYILYNIFYVSYLSKLTNKEIITHIIEETKNQKSTNTIIEQYKNPHIILSNNFSIIEKPTIEVNNSNIPPLVYIYTTHETESYQDKYLEVYNIKPTIKIISYILKDYLEDYGIPTIVETQSITEILRTNNWSYKYSYEASRIAIKDTITNTNSLKLIIDLHRDSSNLSKTLLETNNTKYARILFVVGGENQYYKENLKVSEQLKDLLEQSVPNITRGIITKKGEGVNGIYNQDLSTKSVLIEIGGQYNEIEEINNTIKILSKVILMYIEGE